MDITNDSQFVWRTLIPSGTKNSRGIDVAEDRRGKLNGWFRCFNANPVAVNSTLYFTMENGMSYTFDTSSFDWDENAFISLNDMGLSGTTRTLSHPLVIGNKIYHRTAKAFFLLRKINLFFQQKARFFKVLTYKLKTLMIEYKGYIKNLKSGWQDSNLRPPAPKAGAMTGLRYTPKKFIYNLNRWSNIGFK